MSELVKLERLEHACVVTFNRPEKLNAISADVERELCGALETPELRSAPSVIFTGGPKVFSAGADVNELGGLEPASIISYYDGTGDFPERIADLPQPTFCAISGYCFGGGVELAAATDFRIADRSAGFRAARGRARDPAELGRHPPAGPSARPSAGQGADLPP